MEISSLPFTISPARSPKDILTIASLFTAYVEWLDLDLTYQDYTSELANLPGKYAPPEGELLLARSRDDQPVGCVALRPLPTDKTSTAPELGPRCCEMKRLYILPAGRGLGIGKALVKEIMGVAKRLGYKEMKLDTLPKMHAARKLYKNAGFVGTAAYYNSPVEETIFMKCSLEGALLQEEERELQKRAEM